MGKAVDVSIEALQLIAARQDRMNVPDWCGVEGCARPHRALNLCMAHYLRLYKFRRSNVLEFQYPHVNVDAFVLPAVGKGLQVEDSKCRVPDCGNAFIGRGLCRKHYQVWYRGQRG